VERNRSDSAQTLGWTIDELSKLLGLTRRRIRFYIEVRLLPPPGRSRTPARYGWQHAVGLLAILRWRREEKLSIEAMRERLSSWTPADLEAFALGGAPEGVRRATRRSAPIRVDAPITAPTWHRLLLAPGLELHVLADAPAPVRRAARAIADHAQLAPLR
jgi:DNA-binding transcriptional MerR regulator